MKTSPIYLDRLEKALSAHGVSLKRSQLLETAASAFGFHNSNEFSAAAKRGDLTPAPVVPLGRVDLPDGQAIVIVTDPIANAPYAIDEAFIEQVVEHDRAEQIGVTPYGHLASLRDVGANPIPTLSAGAPSINQTGSLSIGVVEHQHGNDVYIGANRAEVIDQIAKHVSEFWSNVAGEGDCPEAVDGLSSQEIVDHYYNVATDEFYRIHEKDITGPVGATPPVASTQSVPTVDLPTIIPVYVATISHKHGENTYLAATEEALLAQIAAYCREYWSEVADLDEVPEDASSLTDQQAIETYFESHSSEYWNRSTDHLQLDDSLIASILSAHGHKAPALYVDDVEIPPAATLRDIASELSNGPAADIWYDAHAFGDDSAFQKIEEVQSAMGDAARILTDLANARTTVERPSAKSPSLIVPPADEMPLWLTDREGDVTFAGDQKMFDRLGLEYQIQDGEFLPLTDKEFAVVRSNDGHASQFEGFHLYLGESVLHRGQKFHAPYIELAWDDDGNGPSKTECSVELASLWPLVNNSAEKLGGYAIAEYDATDCSHTLQVFLPFSISAQAPQVSDYYRALDYLFNGMGKPDDTRGFVTFKPQAWVNDYAVDTDPEGETWFDAGFEALLWGFDSDKLLDPHHRDEFKDAHLAPRWIRDYGGPFEIYTDNFNTTFFEEHIIA